MRVCVIGAGAIGGWVGARPPAPRAAEGSAPPRGAAVKSLRERGWQLRPSGGTVTAPARVAEAAEELGTQDLVILTVKAPALAGVAGLLPPLLGPGAVVLPFMNGVPWWFGHGTVLGDEPLR